MFCCDNKTAKHQNRKSKSVYVDVIKQSAGEKLIKHFVNL